jgi:hypothetical protein
MMCPNITTVPYNSASLFSRGWESADSRAS